MRLTGQSKQGAQPEQTYSDITKGIRAQPVKSRVKNGNKSIGEQTLKALKTRG